MGIWMGFYYNAHAEYEYQGLLHSAVEFSHLIGRKVFVHSLFLNSSSDGSFYNEYFYTNNSITGTHHDGRSM